MATDCAVCGRKNIGGVCPLCGYEPMGTFGTASQEDLEEEKQVISETRKNLLEKVKMVVKVYDYRNKIHINSASIGIDEPETNDIELKAYDMELNQIKWFDESFANLNRIMPVACEITDCAGNDNKKNYEFAPCRVREVPVHIGIRLKPELKLEVLVGTNNNDFSCSPEFALKELTEGSYVY